MKIISYFFISHALGNLHLHKKWDGMLLVFFTLSVKFYVIYKMTQIILRNKVMSTNLLNNLDEMLKAVEHLMCFLE